MQLWKDGRVGWNDLLASRRKHLRNLLLRITVTQNDQTALPTHLQVFFYRRNCKDRESQNIYHFCPKIENAFKRPKDADGMESSVDPDQTALRAV